jgi:hypothetical protein
VGGLFVTAGVVTWLGTRCVASFCLFTFVVDADLMAVFALWLVFWPPRAVDYASYAQWLMDFHRLYLLRPLNTSARGGDWLMVLSMLLAGWGEPQTALLWMG